MESISYAQFQQLNPQPLLLDVRSQVEYNLRHFPEAQNISLPRLFLGQISWLRPFVLPQWLREKPREQAIAVVCLTAHRSPIAIQQLEKMGFTKLFNIAGGMMGNNLSISLQITRHPDTPSLPE